MGHEKFEEVSITHASNWFVVDDARPDKLRRCIAHCKHSKDIRQMYTAFIGHLLTSQFLHLVQPTAA